MQDGHGWHGEELDLEAYLERVGYQGERTPTLAVLRALQRAHVTSVPFENFTTMLGAPVPLDLKSVQGKLVHSRRGGYCFEHAVLFAAALERLGFTFQGLMGRVTLGASKVLPGTHALLAVRPADDDRWWLCDVGFGRGPLEPIEIADNNEVDFGGWRFRLERRAGAFGDDWWLYQHETDGWLDRHTFTLTPQYSIDYVVGSHYVSTHPRSPLRQAPVRPTVHRHRPPPAGRRPMDDHHSGRGADRAEARNPRAGRGARRTLRDLAAPRRTRQAGTAAGRCLVPPSDTIDWVGPCSVAAVRAGGVLPAHGREAVATTRFAAVFCSSP
ncbi:arylamine N-acetyltransferase family protein [Streptomyces sp. A1-5]|uniref:arylamine N-acetyltransferase family protein n=1 Tax=Streptomyces sp. A1-5 TaxID=2738410 RepID=UPI001F1F63B4|nr:arylamine N-acetyltransferase [Streptomyces sp. A1-5]